MSSDTMNGRDALPPGAVAGDGAGVRSTRYAILVHGEFRLQYAEPGAANTRYPGAGVHGEEGGAGEFRFLPINDHSPDWDPDRFGGPGVHTARGTFLACDGVFRVRYAGPGAAPESPPPWAVLAEADGDGEFRLVSLDD